MIKQALKQNAIEVLREIKIRLLDNLDWKSKDPIICAEKVEEIINEFIAEIK